MYTIINLFTIDHGPVECAVANFSGREAAQSAFRELMARRGLADAGGKFFDTDRSDGELTADGLFDSLLSTGSSFEPGSEDGDVYFIRNERVRTDFRDGDHVFL